MIRKIFQYPDSIVIRWGIVFPVILFSIISLMILNGSSTNQDILYNNFYKQLIIIQISIVLFIVIQYMRIQSFYEYAYHLYILYIILLFLVLFTPKIGGASRWIPIGPFSFQPSESAKLVVIFALAKFITDNKDRMHEVKLLLVAYLIVFFSVILIFSQPDFGTAIIFFSFILPMLFWSGVSLIYIFLSVAPIISVISSFNLYFFSIWMSIVFIISLYMINEIRAKALNIMVNVFFGIISPIIWENLLFPHQQQRILSLLNPMENATGANYQVNQSMIAIGSGGWFGKGIGQGTQTQLRFLPEQNTDFIVSVIGEELGFIGIVLVLGSFFILIYSSIIIASKISNKFFSLSAIGMIFIIFFHILINMGMAIRVFPVTGLPLPFISYGGSFFLMCIFIISLINKSSYNN